jgi:hypothetical protein
MELLTRIHPKIMLFIIERLISMLTLNGLFTAGVYLLISFEAGFVNF